MRVEDLNVVVLAYSRPDAFKKVIESCERSIKKVRIAIDHPSNEMVARKQEKILEIINDLSIECNVVRRQENYGLVRSVLTSIEEALLVDDHVVLLEDDCVPEKEFIEFMARALEEHRENPNISSVCGTRTNTRFNPWGWATWRDKWKYRNISSEKILEIPNLDNNLRLFLKNNTVEHSIWSLSWLAHQHENNCTSAYPDRNLIKNIGFDGSGVHNNKGYTAWLLSQVLKD